MSVDRALTDITAASANGEARIGEVVRGKVSATSKNGSVEVGVREGSAAFLELNTEVGRVYNELAAADAPEAGEPVDKVEVHASTKLGDVTIRRAPRLDEERTVNTVTTRHAARPPLARPARAPRSRPAACASPSARRPCSTAST